MEEQVKGSRDPGSPHVLQTIKTPFELIGYMEGEVFLEGEKIKLRTIEREHLEFLRDGINHPEVRHNLTTTRPQNLLNEEDFFEQAVKEDEDMTALLIAREDEPVGVISLEEKEQASKVAEIGIWIHPDHHGNGYGTEASKLVIDYGFDQLNMHKIYARAQADNEGSISLWKKHGFQKEGEFREHVYAENQYKNVVYYGLLRDER